mmetsp:Transcript_21584/g.43447  ORF Transcript_21584/g.43447 Transcript_21584/m.43447 type:complete len:246 (+) Transcript_21584:81-818(+)
MRRFHTLAPMRNCMALRGGWTRLRVPLRTPKRKEGSTPSFFRRLFGTSLRTVKKSRSTRCVAHRDRQSHTPACRLSVRFGQVFSVMQYIGDTLPGYAPGSVVERARMSHIAMNALDLWGEGRNSFHPVDLSASYSTQMDEALVSSKKFAAGRLLIWLEFFEKLVKRAGEGKPVAGGANVTMADFVLLQVLLAVEAQFNNESYDMAWDKCDVPALKAFKKSMEERPNVKGYLRSDRCSTFAGDSMM